jgi:MFS family permease
LAVGAVVLAIVAGVLPAFTVAAHVVLVRRAYGLGTSGFGLALTVFFAFTALGSIVTPRLAVKVRPAWLLMLACINAALCIVLIAWIGQRWSLDLFLAVAGAGNSLVQPSAARILKAAVAPNRMSLATGCLAAGLGAAPLIPGLLVAFAAGPLGLAGSMTIAAGVALLAACATPLARPWPADRPGLYAQRAVSSTRRVVMDGAVRRVLAIWTVGALLGTVGVNSVAVFFVVLGTHSKLSNTSAGLMLTAASVVAVLVRLIAGALADRRPQINPLIAAALMGSGALGLVVMSFATPATFILGAVLAVAGGWGWTGLLLAAAFRLVPERPQSAGAAMQLGLFGGAAIAPLGFGVLSTTIGLTATILTAAAASLLAAIIVLVGAIAAKEGQTTRKRPTSPPSPLALHMKTAQAPTDCIAAEAVTPADDTALLQQG